MARAPGRQHGTGTAWSTLLRAVQGTQGRGGRRSVRPSASPQRQAGIRTRGSGQRGLGPRRGQTPGSRATLLPRLPRVAAGPCSWTRKDWTPPVKAASARDSLRGGPGEDTDGGAQTAFARDGLRGGPGEATDGGAQISGRNFTAALGAPATLYISFWNFKWAQ